MIETFTCPRHAGNLTLTKHGCASMWTRARGSKCEPGDTLYLCRGCETGAVNAGHPEAVQERKPDGIDRVCVRCHRPARRLIHGLRCVSCYNRILEVRKGRNAKGTRPVRLPSLFSARFAVLDGGTARTVVIDEVTSILEAELMVVRRSSQRVVFLRPSPAAVVRQMTLFGGL